MTQTGKNIVFIDDMRRDFMTSLQYNLTSSESAKRTNYLKKLRK